MSNAGLNYITHCAVCRERKYRGNRGKKVQEGIGVSSSDYLLRGISWIKWHLMWKRYSSKY